MVEHGWATRLHKDRLCTLLGLILYPGREGALTESLHGVRRNQQVLSHRLKSHLYYYGSYFNK